jgi:hypothetical protein
MGEFRAASPAHAGLRNDKDVRTTHDEAVTVTVNATP